MQLVMSVLVRYLELLASERMIKQSRNLVSVVLYERSRFK